MHMFTFPVTVSGLITTSGFFKIQSFFNFLVYIYETCNCIQQHSVRKRLFQNNTHRYFFDNRLTIVYIKNFCCCWIQDICQTFSILVERVFRVLRFFQCSLPADLWEPRSRINKILFGCGTSVPDIFTFSENIREIYIIYIIIPQPYSMIWLKVKKKRTGHFVTLKTKNRNMSYVKLYKCIQIFWFHNKIFHLEQYTVHRDMEWRLYYFHFKNLENGNLIYI